MSCLNKKYLRTRFVLLILPASSASDGAYRTTNRYKVCRFREKQQQSMSCIVASMSVLVSGKLS